MNGRCPLVSSLRGMVAAAHPLAAFAGARVLREGGNAFDAAVATCAALNVVEPFMSGLAGLGMATCHVAASGARITAGSVARVARDAWSRAQPNWSSPDGGRVVAEGRWRSTTARSPGVAPTTPHRRVRRRSARG